MSRECPKCGFFEDEAGTTCPICTLPLILEGTPTIYADGAGWNGQHSAYAFGVHGTMSIYVLHEQHTNNEMELLALMYALASVSNNGQVITDSQLMMRLLRGEWKLKAEHLRSRLKSCQQLAAEKRIHVAWMPRERNEAGKELERWQNAK